MDEATMLQVLGVAPLLCIGATGVTLLPVLVGSSWQPVIGLFPLIALGSLANSAFTMHASVLYVLKRNRDVGVYHVAYIALLAGAGLLLVPALGLIGYGLAEVVAIASYVVLHRQVARLFPLRYRTSAPWLFALAPPLFVAVVPLPYAPLLFVPAAALLCMARFRTTVAYYLRQLRPRAVEG
jgi:O-antigen/teichoic acid export membrane protein